MKKKLYFFLILSALLAVTSLSAQDATTGLKIHYTFDDGTATDATVQHLNGQVLGDVTFAPGKFGNAATMLTKADYVQLPNDITADLTDYTVTGWLKANNLKVWGRLFDFGSGTATYMFLAPNKNDTQGRFAIKLSDASGEQGIDFPTIKTNTWVHFAVTCAYDPTTGIGVGKVYVNGNVVGENDNMTTTPAALGSTTQNWIGLSQWGGDPTIDGTVDDFRVYNRALTQSDIMTVAGYDKVSTLDSIIVPDGTFDVPFAADKYEYNVKMAVGSVTADPELTLSAAGAVVTGDGPVDISSGSGVSTILVTSQDGSTTHTYTLNYTVLALSNDTRLSEILLSEGTLEPAYSTTVYNYNVNLPISVNSVEVIGLANDVLSSVEGNGTIALDQDGGVVKLTVKAENGDVKTYTVNFIKGEVTNLITNPSFEQGAFVGWNWVGTESAGWRNTTNDGDITQDGKLTAGIWASSIADFECSQTLTGLEPGYYQVTCLYTVSNNRLSNQRLFAGTKSQLFGKSTQQAYSAANLAILGATETYTFAGYDLSSKENGPFKKLAVVEHVTDGNLTIGVRLSGQSNTQGYTFPYTTQGDLGFSKWDNFKLINVSKKAALDVLSVTDGAFDVPFSSKTYSYNVSLAKGTVTVDPEVKLSYDGTTVAGDGAVDVSSGSGTSNIVVTSIDGTATRTYTVHYTVRTISNDARLSAINLNIGKLEPAFSPDVYNYKVVVPQHTPSITVSATTKDAGSTYIGTGVVVLNNSNGVDSIMVTAEEGNQSKYKITFERDNATFFKVATAPTIDGIISADEPYASDQWDAQSAVIGKNTKGASSKFQIVHDDAYIYVAAQIIDTTVHAESTIANTYERDCIEFYFNMNPAVTSYAAGVTNFRVVRDNSVTTGQRDATGLASVAEVNAMGVQFAVVSDLNGWVVEGKFPIDSLKRTATFDGTNFTFEIKTADNTTGKAGGRTYQMAWKNNSDMQWSSPTNFTVAVLSPNAVVPVAIKNVVGNSSSIYLDRATKTLHVANAEGQLNIYDLRGSLVRTVALKGINTVNVSNLQSGMYIVKCGNNISKIVL